MAVLHLALPIAALADNDLRFDQSRLSLPSRISTRLAGSAKPIIAENWKKKHKARRRGMLFQGVKKGEPFYRTYVVMQGLLFLYLAIPLATALWPWVAGRPWEGNLILVAVKVIVLSSLVCMWNPLKEANRVTTDALQQDVDETDWDSPMLVWWGGRFWNWVWPPIRRKLPFANRKPRITQVQGITGTYEAYRVGLISIIDYFR
jgi:hypothetical protein